MVWVQYSTGPGGRQWPVGANKHRKCNSTRGIMITYERYENVTWLTGLRGATCLLFGAQKTGKDQAPTRLFAPFTKLRTVTSSRWGDPIRTAASTPDGRVARDRLRSGWCCSGPSRRRRGRRAKDCGVPGTTTRARCKAMARLVARQMRCTGKLLRRPLWVGRLLHDDG
jgi:hypothetical protein